MKRQKPVVVAYRAEAMNVAVAHSRPVDKLDAELERALSLLDEIDLVDLEHFVEQLEMRNGRLADTDRADLLGLDQPDRILATEQLGTRSRSHPARGAATDDDNVFDRPVSH